MKLRLAHPIACLLLLSCSAFSQVSIGFETFFKTDNIYCATIEVQATTETEVELGTSSFFVEYNKNALRFLSYKSKNFDGRNKCPSQAEPAYTNHSFDVRHPGILNTTIFLKNVNDPCPAIANDGVELATVCFEVMIPEQSSNLKFNKKYTQLDKAGLKVELLEEIVLENADDSLKKRSE